MKTKLQALKLPLALAIYAGAAVILYLATHLFIPLLNKLSAFNSLIVWFICGGVFVFVPLFALAIVFTKKEGVVGLTEWKHRLLLTKLNTKGWLYSISASVIIMTLMGLIVTMAPYLISDFNAEPSFMKASKLATGERWILGVWVLFFFFNIIGEELFWRGYMWPRLQRSFGNKTWAINALGWAIFHLSFGWMLLITMLPILIIQPWVMQKTQNTWSGIIIHGLVNGIGFLMVTLVGIH